MGNRPIITHPGTAAARAGTHGTAAPITRPSCGAHEESRRRCLNGTIAALTDDDSARTDATKTFWTEGRHGHATSRSPFRTQPPAPGLRLRPDSSSDIRLDTETTSSRASTAFAFERTGNFAWRLVRRLKDIRRERAGGRYRGHARHEPDSSASEQST